MAEQQKTLRFWLLSGSALAALFAGLGFAATHFVLQAQIERFAERFVLLSSLRKQALEEYFDTARAEITFWSLNEGLLSKQAELVERWGTYRDTQGDPGARLRQVYVDQSPFPPGELHQLQDAGDGSAYSAVHAALHPLTELFVVERGYYDLFLIGPDGDIFYTVEKEADFGTNLETGPWRDTGLADVFRRALASARDGGVVFSDFESYGPSEGAAAMFMAKAMVDAEGKTLGVLALQLPTDRIDSIMRFTAGMGDSGETYLVGEDLLMRSDSRFSDTSTILETRVETDSVKRALAGDNGVTFTSDYRGVSVLSAFSSTEIDNFRWAVMAEIDEDEVLQMVANRRPLIAGLMFVLYSLAMWSIWYIRPGDWGEAEGFAALEIDSEHSDMGG
jgi:methyl-accepting chemotaxis protein